MPISQFGDGLRNTLAFLPGTYGTMLIRNHSLNGVYAEMAKHGFPDAPISGIRDSIDCNVYFFGSKIETWVAYLVLIGAILLLAGLYVLLYNLRRKQK